MKFLVLGATGATGGLFIDKALENDHDVVAYARNPDRLAPRPGVTAVGGDVRDADGLAKAMDGVDAVVSTLGLGRAKDPDDLILDSTRAIVDAAGRVGVRRVLIMSAFGVGDSLARPHGSRGSCTRAAR
ncbi:SDR family oxidoreductase [Antribacter sp. KLBMP9083]|uniref:SDR family oxidoreductase n=1 Tax=Antribacter soli TaxID=2910976 RepID=A0AA41UAW5_9MICO|nr:NAD(P)-binding oxidoreductase [Antribacter soli]MCF4120539.1 SDR family oxidoreductase [Antribacter soli]